MLDPAFIHHHDAIGQLQSLFLVMSDEDAGDVEFVVEPAQPSPQLGAHFRIEGAERLVEQQYAGLDCQCPRERDPLALSAGELRGQPIRHRVELHQLQQLVHAFADVGLRGPRRSRLHPQAKGDVFEHAQMAEQRVMLKHETDRRSRTLTSVASAPSKCTEPRIRQFQPRNDSQQGGLAGARHAQQRDQLAGFDLEADLVERDEIAEGFADVADLDTHAAIFSTFSPGAFPVGDRSNRPWSDNQDPFGRERYQRERVSSEAIANAPAKFVSVVKQFDKYRHGGGEAANFPETTETAPNSPIARALQMMMP